MCQGDYGSPLFWSNSDKNYRATLVGVNVFPYLHHNCKDHQLAIFSYVPRRNEWIKKVLGGDAAKCAPPQSCKFSYNYPDPDNPQGKMSF